MHHHGLVHNALNPYANVLVDAEGKVRIAGFGHASTMAESAYESDEEDGRDGQEGEATAGGVRPPQQKQQQMQ